VARELKQIYAAETAELAAKRLEDFAEGLWGKKLPAIVQSWRRVWEQVIPFFAYPKEIRKIIYTTSKRLWTPRGTRTPIRLPWAGDTAQRPLSR